MLFPTTSMICTLKNHQEKVPALISVQVVFKGTKPDEYDARKQANLGRVIPTLMRTHEISWLSLKIIEHHWTTLSFSGTQTAQMRQLPTCHAKKPWVHCAGAAETPRQVCQSPRAGASATWGAEHRGAASPVSSSRGRCWNREGSSYASVYSVYLSWFINYVLQVRFGIWIDFGIHLTQTQRTWIWQLPTDFLPYFSWVFAISCLYVSLDRAKVDSALERRISRSLFQFA